MNSIEFDPEYAEALRRRRQELLSRVARAAESVGRDPAEITLVAVSKTVDVAEVRAAHEVGYTRFGENRPQELERKLGILEGEDWAADVEFHMIGNLQTNKINHVLGCEPALSHSIASPALATAVASRARARDMVQPVLLEVNVSGEESKSGMSPEELRREFPALCGLEGIEVRGLMTMAPRSDAETARMTFSGLRELGVELWDARAADTSSPHVPELSMGMSEDFEEAVAQGATIIRLGRVVFDPTFPLR